MKKACVTAMALFTALVMGFSAQVAVADSKDASHVVDAGQIQSRIDQEVSRETAGREEIQTMLQRTDVMEIAGRAGLDVTRASAAVAMLSGEELQALASQAAEVNAGIGGADKVVISTTLIIIILLVLILIAT